MDAFCERVAVNLKHAAKHAAIPEHVLRNNVFSTLRSYGAIGGLGIYFMECDWALFNEMDWRKG